MKNLIFFLIFCLILIPTTFAINATSGNYTISMFGNGLQSSTSGSTNYNATSLLTYLSGTRGANTSTYTANIGFFENVTYNRSVIISSYSISPTSATVGSTIDLSISAINAQEVWANITSPNNQVQRLTLTNGGTVTFLPTPSVVGTYTVIFYANSSTGALASAVDTFELTATTSGSSGGSGGGGGGISTCTYNWDCTAWSLCADGKQTRICKNIGSCIGNQSKPIEEMTCSEALFDITLNLRDVSLSENRSLIFNYDLNEKIGIERLDVHAKYTIINSQNNEIFSQIETIAVQNTLNVEKEIDEIKFVDGKYTLRIDILYGNLQRAFAEQKFEVVDGKIKLTSIEEGQVNGLIWFIIEILLILIIVTIIGILSVLWFRKRNVELPKKIRKREAYNYLAEGVKSGFSLSSLKQNLLDSSFEESEVSSAIEKLDKKLGPTNKKKYFIYILITLLIVAVTLLVWISVKGGITGGVIGTNTTYDSRIILIAIIIVLIGLLFIFKKDVAYILEEIIDKITGESFSHKVLDLKNKKVYTESGEHIGKVQEVIVKKNKIDSLKIKLNRKGHKAKGINIKYGHVRAVKGIVIIKNIDLDKI